MGDSQFGSSKKNGPLRSWALRTVVAGGVVALIGEFVRTWGASTAETRQTVNEILGQPPPGTHLATLVGEAMLGIGGAVAVVALVVWLVQQLRH